MMITLGEEEIADVSLATFHLFDDEENVLSGVQLATRMRWLPRMRWRPGMRWRWLPRMRWLSRLRRMQSLPMRRRLWRLAVVAAALVG